MQAPCVFEGYCNSELFEAYVKNILVPILKPGQTVIMDNASFHKSIEHFWFAIKHAVRKILPIFWPDIHAAIDFIFQDSGKPYFWLAISVPFLISQYKYLISEI